LWYFADNAAEGARDTTEEGSSRFLKRHLKQPRHRRTRLFSLSFPIASVRTWLRHSPVFKLLAIAGAAVIIHGYHLGADDAAIYVPAIKQVADPGLYPFGAEFFLSHAHLSFFPNLVGDSAKLTHLPVDWAIFLWHFASIYLLLLATWRLLSVCFETNRARWCGVALTAGVLSVPVAGTALVLMDPYLTARSLSTPAAIFALAAYISDQRKTAAGWLLFAALIHPQMSLYAIVLLGTMELAREAPAVFGLALPFALTFEPARGAAREALLSRTYFVVTNWAWYEWLGVLGPLILLWWFSSSAGPRRTAPGFRLVAGALIPFGLLFTAAGVALSIIPRLENFTRLQPMRAFHLLYGIFFALLGGLIGEYGLKNISWRWLALFVPLAAGMWFLQRASYPASAHVEWPGGRGGNAAGDHRGNDWLSAFFWIRHHTPNNAVFALDPNYMSIPGEDNHGFRAVAERSVLADNVKDSGAVSLFPGLADHWKSQVMAQTGWERFEQADYERLAQQYPVTWIVTRSPGPAFASCLYRNQTLAVCRLDHAGLLSQIVRTPGAVSKR
jgi:hypothetical protein